MWINGDLDYNGSVNVADLADLAGNFSDNLGFTTGGGAAAAVPAAAGTTAPAVVSPTPAATALNAIVPSPNAPFAGQPVQANWADELLDLAE
jgi:hypothetical protein